MNRYEMEPILNPVGRFVIYGDHLNAIEKLEARIAELESKPDYSSEAVVERDRYRKALEHISAMTDFTISIRTAREVADEALKR